ncbi:discoidin domain-containing protein [Niveibacterium sp. SC-1]|uniref:discoidin domain-containing protein n=1 Tax=Niveibacterium sp. SC-1 TaxID=3135646 RepID=UPI00311F984B
MGETPWKYARDSDPVGAQNISFDDSAWKSVGVPNSANENEMFINTESGGGEGFMGARSNWYRKHFSLDPKYAGRKVLVEFEGAHTGVQVYINGTFIAGNSAINPQATHVVGFVPFLVDLTPYVKFDGTDNVMAVKVAKDDAFFRNPGFSQAFRFGQSDAGLFRPVYMYITDKVHIPQNVYSVRKTWGTYVSTVDANEQSATIRVQTNVLNEGTAAQTVTLNTQIVDASGNVVSSAKQSKSVTPSAAPNLAPILFDQTLKVSNPTLWYPNASIYGKPYMYKVLHTVSVDGQVVDAQESPLGIRTIVWDQNFPYINGHAHYLWGGSGRYDYPALGMGVPEEQQWRDLKLLAEAGGSLYRPGHSSSSPEFVAAADALGVMIVQPSGDGENGFADACTDPATEPCIRQTLKSELHRDMIVRDRNNPSILAWEADNGVTDTTFAKSLKALSKVWDPINTRAQADRTPNSENGDILSCTVEGCEVLVKEMFPNNPAWGAEYWGDGSFREAYDYEIRFIAPFLDDWRKGVAKKAFGMVQWYFADTPGESGTYVDGTTGPNVRSLGASMVDGNRLPKMLYYAYQAAWTPYQVKPVVRLAHHWNRGGNIRVNAFSNCPQVRLLINGVQQGMDQAPNPWNSDSSADRTQTTTKLPFQAHWDVSWASGKATARCLDANGQVVATDEKVTAGDATRVVLEVTPGLVKPNGDQFAVTANGSDVAFVTAKVVDAAGNVVPTASNNITFAVSGPGTYRGGFDHKVTQGKPLSYHSPTDPELAAEGGLTRIAIRSQFATGTVTITATSPGLTTGTTSYTVKPVAAQKPGEATTPQIVIQPENQDVTQGQSATFSVTASGAAPLKFQWYKNGALIAGATGFSYTTPATATVGEKSNFSVVVSNTYGNATSANGLMTVFAPAAPVISSQPAAVRVTAGQTAHFQVTAAGSPVLSYQWLKNGAAIDGANSAAYDTPPSTIADNGVSFAVRISNPVSTVTSANAVLTVDKAIAPAITTQPASQAVKIGQAATLSVVATGSAPMHYQWSHDGNAVGNDAADLTIAAVQASDLGSYTVTVSNASGTVTSAAAVLTQAPPGVNLAKGKATEASSYQDANGLPGSAVVDTDTTTRWASTATDPSWILIDFGAPTAFNRVILRWEAAYGSAYEIQVSNDKANWTKVYAQAAGTGGVEDFSFPTTSARYVRMYGTKRGTAYGYSLYEFEVYNVPMCGGAAERFTIVDADNVTDNATKLSWKRKVYTLTDQGAQFTQPLADQYCQSIGMRLPTKDEALAISGDNFAACAFPSAWNTWSSNYLETDHQYAYWVSWQGKANLGVATNFPGWALCVKGTTTGPVIGTQPTSQSVAVGQSAHFTVSATGTGTLSYEWFKNGTSVSVSSSASYDTPATTTADNGASYYVVVTDSKGVKATSQTVTLTVTGGPQGTNLALGKPVTASSTENAGTPASGATDGDGGTRWASAFVDPSWIYVNLGAQKSINKVVLKWEAAYGKAYEIQVSNDATNWTKVYGQANGAGGTETITFNAVTAQYVRMYGTARATGWGYSLFEFEVYGPSVVGPTITTQPANQTVAVGGVAHFSVAASGSGLTYQWFKNGAAIAGATAANYDTPAVTAADNGASFYAVVSSGGASTTSQTATLTVPANTNLALNRPATASSVENAAFGDAPFATDGNTQTRWSSAAVDPSWLQVDLGASKSVSRVVLRWETAYGKAYQIQVSNTGNANDWTTVYTQNAGAGGVETLNFTPVNARYVRMYGTARGTQYGYSLWELEVY